MNDKNTKRFLYLQSPEVPLLPFSEACLSLTPKVSAIDTAVFLEIGCTEKLFGGESRVLLNAHRLADGFHLKPWFVLNDRPEWARALATEPEVIIPAGKSQARLLALPIERLVYCGDPITLKDDEKERVDLIRFMKRVGMESICDFAKLSPLAVIRRFGKAGTVLQQWVKGEREVVLPLLIPDEKIVETVDTEEVPSLELLVQHLENPIFRMASRLKGRGLSAKHFTLTFCLDSKEKITKTLSMTEPSQEASVIHRLFKECLEHTHWDSPLMTLTILVSESVKYERGQLSLFDESSNQFAELAEFVSRMRARYGEAAVGFPALQASYLPEKSWKNHWPPPQEKQNSVSYPIPHRPMFLFQPPQSCSPREDWKMIPSENLATDWWEGVGNRNYFIAQNRQGENLWVFFDKQQKSWFLHGTFD